MTAELFAQRCTRVPVVLAVIVVVVQIAYPLAHGSLRDTLTIAIVILFAATAVTHAAATRGLRTGYAVLAFTAVPGFAAEAIGVRIGVPFGSYAYRDTLGPQVLNVPVVVALAWTMLAWPAAVAARHLAAGFAPRVLIGAWALATADLFLDPQMVAAGHWHWDDPSPSLPGIPNVPLTNYAGWAAVALVLSVLLQILLRGGTEHLDDRVPLYLYLWLWLGWVVALGVFLDLPAAAAWGALGMGCVGVPLAVTLVRR
ncbi:MAG: carotenoid biosynthesis protein [Jatrophihabitans sp.]